MKEEELGLPNSSSTYTGNTNPNPSNAMVVKLMAKWRPKVLQDLTYMQDMTATICNNTITPNSDATTYITSYSTDKTKIPQATLKDSRDNKSYRVRKLPDGSCWMIDFLKLGQTSNMTLTASTTDLEDGTTFILHGAQIWNDNSINEDTDRFVIPSSSLRKNNTGNFGEYQDDYGYYYNATAASAGSRNTVEVGADMPYSICPKNWKLPNENNYNSITSIYNTSDKLIGFPFEFLTGGHWYIPSASRYGLESLNWKGYIRMTKKTYYSSQLFIVRGPNSDNSYAIINTDKVDAAEPIRCVVR